MKKQNRMEKMVRRLVIASVVVFLLGTLVPLVGSAVELGNGEKQGRTPWLENVKSQVSKNINMEWTYLKIGGMKV